MNAVPKLSLIDGNVSSVFIDQFLCDNLLLLWIVIIIAFRYLWNTIISISIVSSALFLLETPS